MSNEIGRSFLYLLFGETDQLGYLNTNYAYTHIEADTLEALDTHAIYVALWVTIKYTRCMCGNEISATENELGRVKEKEGYMCKVIMRARICSNTSYHNVGIDRSRLSLFGDTVCWYKLCQASNWNTNFNNYTQSQCYSVNML